jgi:carboxyl-terminal processing protease
MGKEEKSKVSIGTTIFWMIITAVMVCCIVSIKNTREMLTSEEYYDSIFGIKTYSGEFEKLKKVMGIIESDYLKEYDVEKLEEGAIRGMLEALDDPYTSYFDKSETESFLTETEGDYEGVGMYISIDTKKDTVIVLSPIKGSPAEEAGVKPGDYITEINGVSVVGVSLEEVASRLKGISGSTVDVKFVRYNDSGDAEEIEKSIPRRKVELTSFESKLLDDDIAYISFSSFDENITEKFEEAINELFKKKKAKGLILDVRNNPGGLLSVATEVADKLLPTGKIVYTVDKNGKEEAMYSDSNFIDVPIVVLVNENSASASEILAAALKDYGATIVGTTTYGKGLVQEFKSLRDGTYVKVTISEYFSPNGTKINETGVIPNIEVRQDEDTEEDEQLERAIIELKKKM